MILSPSFKVSSWDFLISISHLVPHIICFFLFSLQGKATGNKAALWIRAQVQNNLFKLGYKQQRNAGKFLLFGFIILASFSACLKSAIVETRLEKLWVQGKLKPILVPSPNEFYLISKTSSVRSGFF